LCSHHRCLRELQMFPISSSPAPALYALLLDAAVGNRTAALDVCREHGLLGVGWGVGSEAMDWPSYEQRATELNGFVHAAVQELHDLPHGSLIWTKDSANGAFYLAKVTGPWRYLHGATAESSGMHNVRSVRVVICGSATQVPATIASCFIGGWVIQRIYDDHLTRRSERLFDELAAEPDLPRPTLDEVLTDYLDDTDVYSLVCAYIQRRFGYLAMPPARRPGLGSWEYVLRDGYGCEAIVRAKRGGSIVSCNAPSLPADVIDRVFVFSPTGTYGAERASNVIEIDYDELIDFMRDERWHLPGTVEQWVSRALDDVAVRPG